MTKLSVNINKIATIRNARGGNTPNVVEAAIHCQKFGADGITIHPRTDERHITKKDVYDIKPIINTEYNIEGYPSEDFIKMVLEIEPDQVTLVPDGPNVLTSCAGWDTIKFQNYLREVISIFKDKGIRTSIFTDPKIDMIEGAKNCGTDRIELYTENYALGYNKNKEKATAPYIESAEEVTKLKALCLKCNDGTEAAFTKRIVDDNSLELVGSNEKYIAGLSLRKSFTLS